MKVTVTMRTGEVYKGSSLRQVVHRLAQNSVFWGRGCTSIEEYMMTVRDVVVQYGKRVKTSSYWGFLESLVRIGEIEEVTLSRK